MGFYTVLLVIHTIIVLFLIGIILVQRSDNDGMGGLSGGGGANQFLTGRGKANLLTRSTAILATVFMLTSLLLAVWTNRISNQSILDSVEMDADSGVTRKSGSGDLSTNDAAVVPLPESGVVMDAKQVASPATVISPSKPASGASGAKSVTPSVPTPE